jgi:energy-coupling factor transporter ATP-binding protein EcfA2
VGEPLVRVRDVHYRYGSSAPGWVLDGINLKVQHGEYLLLSGASGSGKSTLCRLFNGLIPHFYGGEITGDVVVAGLNTGTHPVAELFAHVSMVFQSPGSQLFNATVARELAFGLESLGLPRAEIARRVDEVAETAGLAHLLARNPQEISGGEQQLVSIGAALALRPELIVLDEPYASLDPANVRRVRDALRKIHRQGTAIVVAEHRLEHVVPDAQRMVVLHAGHIVHDGPLRSVLAQNLAPFGLNPPAVVRMARAAGLSDVPLTVEDLVASAGRGDLSGISHQLRSPEPRPATGERPVLQADGLTFSFDGTPILRGVSLTLRPGECLALVGANGSGKTTLIKHFNGLRRPDEGHLLVLGCDTRRVRTSELARHVGLAFQDADGQFFKFQVRDEIEVGPRALGRYDPEWLDELVALFRLEPLLDRSPYRLSAGEKKRVAFASALATRPEILVLDEPTTGQDWGFRQALGRLLGDLSAQDQTVVMVTHDLEFAEEHACRWTLLAEGRVLADGPAQVVMGDALAMERADLEPTQAFQIRQALAGGVR